MKVIQAVYPYIIAAIIIGILLYVLPAYILYKMIRSLRSALEIGLENYDELKEKMPIEREALEKYVLRLSQAEGFLAVYVLVLIFSGIPGLLLIAGPLTLNNTPIIVATIIIVDVFLLYLGVIPRLGVFYKTVDELFYSETAGKVFTAYIAMETLNVISLILRSSPAGGPWDSLLGLLYLILLVLYLAWFRDMAREITFRGSILRSLTET